jgi:hypothetical protein
MAARKFPLMSSAFNYSAKLDMYVDPDRVLKYYSNEI